MEIRKKIINLKKEFEILKYNIFNKVFKNISYVLFANIISQIESMIFVAIAARMWDVDTYGIYSVVTMILSLAIDLSDMGMNGAIVRFSAEYSAKGEFDKEEKLIDLVVKRKIRNSIITCLTISIFSPLISLMFLDNSNYFLYIVISSIAIIFALVYSLNNSVLQGRQEYKGYFKSMICFNSLLFIMIILLFIFNKFTVMNVIIINVINYFLSFLYSMRLIKFDFKSIFIKKDLEREVKSKFTNYSRWMVLWSVLSILQSRLDILMLANLTTTFQVAYYDIGMKLSKPFFMIFNSAGQVINPIFATILTKEELKSKFAQVRKISIALSVLIIISILICRYPIIIIFGDKYINSIIPLQIILMSLVFFIWTMPFNAVLYSLNKPHVFVIASGLGLIATFIGNLYLLPIYGAVGASITYLIAQVIGFIISYLSYKYYEKKLIK
ncbi:oligosaccharide flippase family protein [Clostridium sp.]|jgi:O-antigen/teichoic acid export membrane protein|uniref:oligosaccharide flippase family protein n=1 Tax=Clostridium sp. TaxID=1506 RepID=UPI002908BCB9|nr:oligosaccharide flippase family protein [Clostridium sp.]MDU7363116.1 oligosaccharide flippase family protein [Clostridium sp.]